MSFDPLTAGIGLIGNIIDKIVPDKAQADAAKLEFLRLEQTGELAQMTAQTEINKVEAASSSLFVAGWRPFIGWVCGLGCAWNWVFLPIAKLVILLLGYTITLSMADLSEMMPLLMGMLGIGGLRTYEKIKGVTK